MRTHWEGAFQALPLVLFVLLGPARATALGTGVAPPPNDACANATAISTVPHTDTALTGAATTEPSDPTLMIMNDGIPCGGDSSEGGHAKSVWYVFTAPTDGIVTADTFDSDYDTILSVYTGSCGSFQPVSGDCNDDDPPCGCNDDDAHDGAQSRISLLTSAGTTYYFMVSAFSNDGGNLVFHFTFAPSTVSTATPSSAATATSGRSPTPTSTSLELTMTATPTPTAHPPLSGDANCDGRRTAADLSAEIMLIVAADRAPCGLDDTNHDGALSEDDIPGVIAALFAP